MVVTTPAIVFSSVKYSEADLIVTCYTRTSGIKSYLLRGILKSKKGKLKTSYFQPLTQLELEAVHKDKGTLERIRETKVVHPYSTLHTQVVKGGVVMFLAEMLKNCIKEEAPNPPLYDYLEGSFLWLDSHDKIANFHLLFLLKLTAFLGIYPDTSNIEGEWFNLQEGYFTSQMDGNYCETGDSVNILKGLFGIDFDALETVNIDRKKRSEVLNLLLAYYQLHLQGYKKPRSLPVLNELFN